jgi:hypothetical protein
MDLIALPKGVEDMVVNVVLISIISVVAVVIVNNVLDSKMKSLWIMMKKKDPLMMRIPLVVVEDLVGVIDTGVLILPIGGIIAVAVIMMILVIMLMSNYIFQSLLAKRMQMNILSGLNNAIRFSECIVSLINVVCI